MTCRQIVKAVFWLVQQRLNASEDCSTACLSSFWYAKVCGGPGQVLLLVVVDVVVVVVVVVGGGGGVCVCCISVCAKTRILFSWLHLRAQIVAGCVFGESPSGTTPPTRAFPPSLPSCSTTANYTLSSAASNQSNDCSLHLQTNSIRAPYLVWCHLRSHAECI